jgi:cytochrome c peroxidase
MQSDRDFRCATPTIRVTWASRRSIHLRRVPVKPFKLVRHQCIWFTCLFMVAVTGPVARFAVASDDADLLKDAKSFFKPLPKDMATAEFPVTPERVRLGRALFFDPRIAADGAVSCSRCHLPALYATDALPRSLGVHDQRVPRNAPTVLNAALYFKEHWDGQFASVEEQATKALLGPAFGSPDYATAMARVKAIPGYVEMFQLAFPGDANPVSEDHWGKAIGAYERTLVSPSQFDEFLNGKSDALSAAERKGLRTFIDTGCVECHKGPALGGLGFRKFGVFSDYWKATGSKEIDKGRIGVTKDPADLYKFKVAGLRNVAKTPPYFHDGAVDALPTAVRIMAKVQLDADLADSDVNEIVTFLGSLTGKMPEEFERAPVLPPAGFSQPSAASANGTTK